jgi:hypothetical protein
MTQYAFVFVIVAIIIAGIGMLVIARGRFGAPRQSAKPSPGQRLSTLAKHRRDYRILIGVPPHEPNQWLEARCFDEVMSVANYGDVPLDAITAFVVAYPNGQVVDCEVTGLNWPPGITGLEPGPAEAEIIRAGDLKSGEQFLQVTYGRSKAKPNDVNCYSTTLTNRSHQLIRVVRFAAYVPTSRGFELSTVTGGHYSAAEFQNWYGLGTNEWIFPGELVTDHNNYGGIPILWAYHCETEHGEKFIAAALLEKRPPPSDP